MLNSFTSSFSSDDSIFLISDLIIPLHKEEEKKKKYFLVFLYFFL